MENELVKYILPEGFLDYFQVDRVEHQIPEDAKHPEQTTLFVYLTEKNNLHSVEDPQNWETKDFTKPKKIKDFPLRARNVYLVLRMRRWRYKTDKNRVIQNTYHFLAEGTRISAELSAFLKSAHRDA